MRFLKHHYERTLIRVVQHRKLVLALSVFLLLAALGSFLLVGGEFMPPLEEGNLWIRTTLPQDVSLNYSARIANQMRHIIGSFPEVSQVVSQVGRS